MLDKQNDDDQEKMKVAIAELLRALLGTKEAIDFWWNSPNKGLQMRKPIDAPITDVYNYLLGALGPW